MKHTIDDVKKVNPEFRMYHNRIGLFNSHFQNFKQFGVPKAQLILTDIPYNIGKNAYGSNPVWYVGGDNKNGESDLAGEEFFDTDKDFRPAEFMHFLQPDATTRTQGERKAPCMIVFCEFEQQFYLIELARRYGLNNYINLVFRKNYSAQVLKANMRVVGNCEYGLILYRDKLPKFNNHGQMIFNCFDWSRDLGCQKIHPTQKPLALLRQLVELFTDPDDVVIDPCAGSGSSLIAAAGLNRKAYGFEIKKNIYSDACELIKHNIQFDLFAESQQMERRRQAMHDTRTLFDVNETKEDEK